MKPIIQYQGEVYQALLKMVQMLNPYANKLWVALAILWLFGLLYSCFRVWMMLKKGADGLTKRDHPDRLGVVGGLVWVLGGIFMLRLPSLALPAQNTDEGQWIASVGTLIADPRFWLSVDGTTSGPLNVYPLTIPYLFGLSIDYATIRLVGLLALLGAVGFLFGTFRHLFGKAVARLAVLPMAVVLAFMPQGDGLGYNSEHFPMLLLAAAIFLLSKEPILDQDSRRSEPIGAFQTALLGFVLGCVPYTKLQAIPLALVLAAGALLLVSYAAPERWKRLGWLVLGGLLPSILVVIYLAYTDNFEFFWKSFILANLGYAEKGSFGRGVDSWSDKLMYLLPLIYSGLASSKWFFACLPILVVGGFLLFFQRRLRPVQRLVLAFLLLWLVTAIYSTLKPGNRFYHYQLLAYVPAFLLAGVILGIGVSQVGRKVQVWLVGMWLLALVVGPGVRMALLGNTGIRVLSQGADKKSALASRINQYAQPNEKMVVWGWDNHLHVETGLLMGSRFIPVYYPVIESELQPYFLDVHQQDILKNRPVIIVDVTPRFLAYQAYSVDHYPFVVKLLADQYHFIGTVEQARVFVRKDRYNHERSSAATARL
ncbi:hypothetical protein [Tellurirhabdus bombi]|uniref:hypothetical protein n=1 Tax=Tellurirhabdus bombi TaxID=2907205 RepID=UPI001F338ED0|nr:hypothetical protein [Tellurirhabdus bombi]